MKKTILPLYPLISLIFFCFFLRPLSAQMITGVWKGKINRQKAEVKIIQNGDSLTGSSYYYESANNYRRYTIKGYFDETTNAAVWWDDQLVEERSGRFSISTPGKMPMLSRADFNCPGGGKMMLDGKAALRDDDPDNYREKNRGDVHLDKTGNPQFQDEWDFVIDNYTSGANDPEIIDSVGLIALTPPQRTVTEPEIKPVVVIASPPPVKPAEKPVQKPGPVIEKTAPPLKPAETAKAPTIEEKFTARRKTFIKEIPLAGDSIELRFYDNAEIDGDSISLFLNDKLLFQHIRLTGNAHIIKLAAADMSDSNELTMVAENLGAIPPNTSYMVAIVNGIRHDAYLSSTEGSSAMIRFVKK